MWMFAEVVDSAGNAAARAEGEIKEDGELAALIARAIDRFGADNPGRSLLTAIGQAGYQVRCGKAEKAYA